MLRYFERLRGELRGLARGIPAADALLALPRQRLDATGDRLPRALRANAHSHRVEFARAAARLSPASIQARFERFRGRPAECLDRLGRALGALIRANKARILSLSKLVEAFSYHKVLDRGFALVRDAAGQPVRSAAAVAVGDMLDIELADGHLPAVASEGTPKKKRGSGKGGGQGGLFD